MARAIFEKCSNGTSALLALVKSPDVAHEDPRMLLLEYNHSTLVDDQEPSRYHRCIDGKVKLCDDEDADQRTTIGHFSIIVIDVEAAVNEEERMFDVFDCDGRTVDYFSLYDEDMGFAPEVTKVLKGGERWAPNMLVIDDLKILPKYRGKGYGLQVLRWLQLHFGTGCGIVAMIPFPLQFAGWELDDESDKKTFAKLQLGTFSNNRPVAFQRLRSYFARAGFVRVPDTEYMISDPQMKLPSIRSLRVVR